MDELPIKLKKYFSKEGIENSATLSYWFEPHKEGKGAIGFFVSISGSSGFSVERVAKFMWDSFRETYMESKGDSSSSLKMAMKSSHKRLLELIKNEERLSENGLDIHIAGMLLEEDRAYVCRMGNPEIFLIREENFISITDSLPGFEGGGLKEEIPVGIFDLRKSDIFFISTPQLAESVIDVFTDAQEISWSFLMDKLDDFSEGLVGSQYIWLIGYRIDETPKIEIPKAETMKKIQPKANVTSIEDVNEIEVLSEESGSTETQDTPQLPESSVSEKKSAKEIAVGALYSMKNWFSGIDFQSVKRNIGSKVSGLKLRGGSRKRKMFVDKNKGLSFGNGSNKRKLIGIGIIVGVIVIVLFVVRSQRSKAQREEVDSQLASIQSDLEEADGLWQSDRMQSEEIISQVFEDIDDLEGEKLTGEQSDELGKLEEEAQGIYDQIHRIVAISEDDNNFEILFDSYLDIDESADITDFAIKEDTLYLVDKSTHGVYGYTIGGDAIKAVADSQSEMKEPIHIAVGEKYMFVYDDKIGMLSLDLEDSEADQSFNTMPELSARTIEEATSISTFADNIYILKSSEARVLKSFPAGFGYSYPEEYFRHGALDKAKDILIDGNIYVIGNSSEPIYKFFGGKQDQFALTEMDEDFDGVCCGFTNISDSRPLYVFDEGNKRIVVIEKGTGEKHPGQGVMISQMVYRGSRDDVFEDVREIVVDGDEENLYVLDGTRVLRISL